MKRIIKRLGFVLIVIAVLLLSFWAYLCNNHTTPILMYHSLDKEKVGIYAAVDPAVFYRQMEFIKKGKYQVISLDEYCQKIKDKKAIPWNAVVITFDDGYRDNLEGVRTLRDFGFPATIFVIVNKIGQEGYLSRKDIDNFIENTEVRIGSHGMDSAYFPEADNDKLTYEINDSKYELEKMFFQQIKTMAYPVGGFDERALKEVESADYLCACTTNRGFSSNRNRYALRRIKISNRDLGIRLWAKLSGFYNVFRKVKNPY